MTLDKNHKELGEAYSRYLMEYESFAVGKKKVAAARARKALAEFSKLAKVQRACISDTKNKMGGKTTGGKGSKKKKSSKRSKSSKSD